MFCRTGLCFFSLTSIQALELSIFLILFNLDKYYVWWFLKVFENLEQKAFMIFFFFFCMFKTNFKSYKTFATKKNYFLFPT